MHAMHLFSAAKAEEDLRGELARHIQVHDKLARESGDLGQWHSGFNAAVQRTAREPRPRCTRHRQGLLARRDKQVEAPVCVYSLEDRLRVMQDTSEASRGQQRALAERSKGLALRLEAALELVQTRGREVDTLRPVLSLF
jgi:hypothetical protein